MLRNDIDLAVGQLNTTRTKVFTLTPIKLRAAAKAVLLFPFTASAALFSQWRAVFAGQRWVVGNEAKGRGLVPVVCKE